MSRSLGTYLLAILALLALTLAAFAVVWPLNTTAFDDWVYFYAGQPTIMSSSQVYAVRPFALGGAMLAHFFMPGQAQSIYLVHVVSIFIASVCLFHIMRRLNPGYDWMAFLLGAVYLFYVPFN